MKTIKLSTVLLLLLSTLVLSACTSEGEPKGNDLVKTRWTTQSYKPNELFTDEALAQIEESIHDSSPIKFDLEAIQLSLYFKCAKKVECYPQISISGNYEFPNITIEGDYKYEEGKVYISLKKMNGVPMTGEIDLEEEGFSSEFAGITNLDEGKIIFDVSKITDDEGEKPYRIFRTDKIIFKRVK